MIIYANDFKRGSKKAFYNYCFARFKLEKESSFQKDYNSNMLYNLVQASEKFKGVKSWQEVIKPLREPNSIDNRTDEEIEEQTIKEYNRIYGIE